MMIIRVLPIHVPPCYEGGYLKPLHWNHNMTYDDHLVWPIHVPRRCEPLITPHLSLWGNARTRATFPTHKKSHNPHPQGGGGEGGQDGYITLGGGGGGACQTWIIYVVSPLVHSHVPSIIHNLLWFPTVLLLTPLSLRPASVLSVIYRFYASLQCQTLYNFFIGNKNGSLRPVCLCKNKSATSLTPELSLVFKSTLPSVLILYIFFVSICIFCIYIHIHYIPLTMVVIENLLSLLLFLPVVPHKAVAEVGKL